MVAKSLLETIATQIFAIVEETEVGAYDQLESSSPPRQINKHDNSSWNRQSH